MSSPFSYKRFRLVFICCWLVIFVQQALLLYFYELPWKIAVADSLVFNGLLLLCTLLIINTLRYYLPGIKQYFNFFIICFILSILQVLLGKWMMGLGFGSNEAYIGLLQKSVGIRISISLLFLLCVSLICIILQRQQ